MEIGSQEVIADLARQIGDLAVQIAVQRAANSVLAEKIRALSEAVNGESE